MGIKERKKQLSDLEVIVNGDSTVGCVVAPSGLPIVGPRNILSFVNKKLSKRSLYNILTRREIREKTMSLFTANE